MDKIHYIVVLVALVFLVGGAYAFTNLDGDALTTNSDDNNISSNTAKDIPKIMENTAKSIPMADDIKADNGEVAVDSNNVIVQSSKPPFKGINDTFTEDDLFKTFVDEYDQEFIYIGNMTAEEYYQYDIQRHSSGNYVPEPTQRPSAEECMFPLIPYSESDPVDFSS